ncbi:MAG: hypothetical protein AB7F76_00340 [Parvibaculaceae bacterium]
MSSPESDAEASARAREQYEAIESAVMETPRGRWFLAEYARRHRNADTETLLAAMAKLEKAITPEKSANEELAPGLRNLAEDIKTARQAMASVKSEMLPDAPKLPETRHIYRAIAAEAQASTKEITRRTVKLRVIAGGLKAERTSEVHVAAVEAEAQSLQKLAWTQDVLSERIAKAMGLLEHLDEAIVDGTSEAKQAEMTVEQLPYFSRDEDLFEPVASQNEKAAEPEPAFLRRAEAAENATAVSSAVTDKSRIVVIKRSKSEPSDIPLAG